MMTNEIVPPANVPNSYHSSQTDTITKSDTHRSSEQTIHTETCRITETTMRMEHKSPLPDIEFNPSPRPFELNENTDMHTTHYMDNTNHSKHMIDTNPVPQYQHHPQSPPHRTEYDHFIDTETLQHKPYTTYEMAHQRNHIDAAEHLRPNGNIALIDEPAANTSCDTRVSERVKLIEKGSDVVEPTYKPFKPVPTLNVPLNDFPFARCNLEKQTDSVLHAVPPHQNGKCTPSQLNETIEEFSSKIHEFQQCHWSNENDLKAPALVKHAAPVMKPNVGQMKAPPESFYAPLNLEPGEPAQLCFAPRILSDKKPSLLEKIEKTLEKDATKVLPHSVRMIPPPPPPPPSEHYSAHNESGKHITKQCEQYEINQPHKNLNHIKNTFYEHTTPLHRNTFAHVPTPTKAPEKVRIWSVCVCVSVCYQLTMCQSPLTKINRNL